MIIETLSVGLLQCNCTVLGCGETRRALVIDPGDEADRILDVIGRHKLTVEAILQTHAHLDHLGATCAVARSTGAPVLLHPGDRYLYDHAELQAQLFGLPKIETAEIGREVQDGETLRIGALRGKILHTPGHSPGSLCLAVSESGPNDAAKPAYILSGDTLFCGSIGRTDLWGGDMDLILNSIRKRLLPYPDATVVVPGHGPATTIGAERATNPFLAP
ncbi:MAG: MBL fold metallo-hydrolase [Candidatus Eisenbacteria bacterium]|nr:MBL fold metallo-hydrolase [Candidatus Eisenbacteria bacterium]